MMMMTRYALPVAPVALVALVLIGPAAGAQDITNNDHGSAVRTIVKQVFTDPTTYAPSAIVYTSMKLDWNSSQPLFAEGYLEQNRRYTQSGRALDLPVSYDEGNRRLLMQSLAVLPSSIANNTINRVLERTLTERFPEKHKLWTTLGWIERVGFASFTSYALSGPHFEQWQRNTTMIQQVGK
jgi:hypothetical protein